jgi:hypothetical protein
LNDDKLLWYIFIIILVTVSVVAVDFLIILLFDIPKIFWINVHAFSLIIVIAIYLLIYKIVEKFG